MGLVITRAYFAFSVLWFLAFMANYSTRREFSLSWFDFFVAALPLLIGLLVKRLGYYVATGRLTRP